MRRLLCDLLELLFRLLLLVSVAGLTRDTGGGSVLDPRNQTMLSGRGLVVFLSATVAQQLERLRRDKQRPLLQTADRKQRLQALAADRDPIYRQLADLVIISDGRSVPAMARLVSQQLTEQHGFLTAENSNAHTDD